MRDHAVPITPGGRSRRRGLLCRAGRSLVALLTAAAACWSVPAATAATGDRVALVIGNSRYTDLPPLENPYNDAKGIAAALWQAGFETIEVLDADREEMVAAIATFAKRVGAGTDAVFFYAGHGVQSGGSNYLLPVSTTLEDSDRLADHAVDANEIVGVMGKSEARINIVILDACRDNPFLVASGPSLEQEIAQLDPALLAGSGSTKVVVRASAGLAPLQPSRVETVVGYSTGPGQVALDGDQNNSPYTSALLQHINTPGLEIDMMFRRVRATVREMTKGWQIPWMASTLESEFYFRPLAEGDATSLDEALVDREEDTRKLGLAPPQRLVEEAFWQVVTAGDRREDYLAYLYRYPEGEFAAEAQQRIGDLDSGEAPEAPTTSEAGPQVAYLGVGPVPIALSGQPDLADDVLAMRVRAIPTSGTFFRRDNTPVVINHLLSSDELADLRFLPKVGTKSTGVAEPLMLAPLTTDRSVSPWIHRVISEIHPCDLLAGFAYAPDRVWDGVQLAILKLDPQPAIDACLLAVRQFPNVVRFVTLLTRSYGAAGQFEEARQWAENASERGYASGMGLLGRMYLSGTGVEPNYPRALELFAKAYELGDPGAPQGIGEMYEAGLGVAQDYARAAEWYRKGIELGNGYAATQLARLHEKGAGVEPSMERAIALYRDAAAVGDLAAQLRLARIYHEGISVEPDRQKALTLFQAAAGTGMPTGQMRLGQYYEGEGQIEQAVYWYEKADANRDPWAPLYLGGLYLDSEELGQDSERAVALLKIALERGNPNAARQLAKIYESDRLGAPAPEIALSYHRRAAEEGNVFSMRDLARALLSGEGIARDVAAATGWMTRAADGGNPWAQRDLGASLATGDLVDRVALRAAFYLGLAIGSGEEAAANSARDELERRLSAEERVRATQTWLADLGYDVGPADGMAGPGTEAAIARFAADRGIAPAPADSPDLIARLAPLVRR
jgi:TPR repeat protein